MAFVRAAAGWFSGQEAGPRRRKQAPPPQASLRATCPALEISGQVHRVPGLLSELREALPATHRTKRFPPWTTRPSSSPTLAEAECPGRTRDVGPGRGAGHGSAPGGAGPGGRIPGQRTGSPVGSLACAPAGRPRALLRLQRPHPATRRQTWTQPLQPSSLCGTTQKWSVTAATSVPQSSKPHLCEGIGGLLSSASAKGIHLR